LYPFIQRWPVPSQSAETLLARREGDNAVFLNDLRHVQQAALRLRIPLTRSSLPAVQAILGKEGILRGVDYRGVPVIAAAHKVPETPWVLIAKMDVAEVSEPTRRGSMVLSAAAFCLILAAGVGVFQMGRRQQLAFDLARSRTELERQ